MRIARWAAMSVLALTACQDDLPPDRSGSPIPGFREVMRMDAHWRTLQTDTSFVEAEGQNLIFLEEVWRRNCLVQAFNAFVAEDPLRLVGISDTLGTEINIAEHFYNFVPNWQLLIDNRAVLFPSGSRGVGVNFFFSRQLTDGDFSVAGMADTTLTVQHNVNVSRIVYDTFGEEHRIPAHELGHNLGLDDIEPTGGPLAGDTTNLMWRAVRAGTDTLYGFEPGQSNPTPGSQCHTARSMGQSLNILDDLTFLDPI